MSEKNSRDRYHNILPRELTPQDLELTNDFLDNTTPEGLSFWTRQYTKEYSYRGQDFNVVVDKPYGGNTDKAVVVMSEFGTNRLPRLIAKSRVARDMVDPEATLIIQPNSVCGENNMNFSSSERERLRDGDLRPIIGRISVALDKVGNPSDVTMYGISQGAMIGLECASSEMLPPVALALFDIPTVTRRSIGRLAFDFASSGSDLPLAVRANYDNQNASLAEYTMNDARLWGLAKWFFRSLHPDSLAIAKAMRKATASERIQAALDHGSCVVHSWGTRGDKVSPELSNEMIADKFKNNPRYNSRRVDGDHSLADFYAFGGALARTAHNLKTSQP